MARARGERRVCSMVRAPSPEEEDRRRLTASAARCSRNAFSTPIGSRACSAARASGITIRFGAIVLNGWRRCEPATVGAAADVEGGDPPGARSDGAGDEATGCGRTGPRRAHPHASRGAEQPKPNTPEPNNPGALLLKLKGIGPEFASLLWLELLFRSFGNRRQVAAYSGLAPSPWQSGSIERDQGISKSGNRRLRKTMIELAWFWLRHQPDLALSRWFQARVGVAKGRIRRIAIVALARKLLVALWRFVTQGASPWGRRVQGGLTDGSSVHTPTLQHSNTPTTA